MEGINEGESEGVRVMNELIQVKKKEIIEKLLMWKRSKSKKDCKIER